MNARRAIVQPGTVTVRGQADYKAPPKLNDTVTVTDSILIEPIITKGLNDAVAMADGIAFYIDHLGLDDSVAMLDNITPALTMARDLADSVTMSDAAVVTRNLFAALNDTATMSDGVSSVRVLGQSNADAVTMSDNITPNLVSFEAEATALFARMTTQPDTTRKVLINTTIKALKDAGVWAKLDSLYVLAAHEEATAKLNWVSNTNNITPVAAPTYTVDRGWLNMTSSQYLNTNYDPDTVDAVLFTQNDAHYCIWRIEDGAASTDGAEGTSAEITLRPITIGNKMWLRVNDLEASGASPESLDGRGMWLGSRTGASTKTIYKDGSLFFSSTAVSAAISGYGNLYIGAVNTSSGADTHSMNDIMCSIGGSLTSIQTADFYNAMYNYFHTIGAV